MPITLDPTLESALGAALRRFRWLRFWRLLSVAAFAVLAAALLAGVAMDRGWLARPGVALGLLVMVTFLALLALPVAAVAALAPGRSREWSARHVEEANPTLLDRLNAVVFLQGRSRDPVLARYGERIERQAVREMLLAARPFDGEQRRLARRWLGLLLLALATVLFYDAYRPWQKLRERPLRVAGAAVEELLLEAPIVDAEELREERPEPAWGEVRITEPGRDVKVTKVDVVPLQIEAAASHALAAASWVATPTGGEPRRHELPPPAEPRFAVYRPHFYVDELRLADWDVVSYYAEAATAQDGYASEIYFLEVRPFREEIEKLKGSGGAGAGLMNECTGLIERQKHVLRQTHRFLARPPEEETARAQDQEKLVDAEAELAEATRHLYARMAAEMEHHAIANVLDRLAAAEAELERAAAALRDSPPTAPEPEQSALAELVATRKDLQRAISENPEAFGGEQPPQEDFPIAEELKRILELRDEERTAHELLGEAYELKELLDRQAAEMGEMAARPGEHSRDDAARAAGTAREITRELKEMVESSPAGQTFGPELHEALADPRQERLERDLDALAQAAEEAARAGAADAAREGLEAVSDAFEKSAPALVRRLRSEDALTPGDAEALESARRQLEALLGAGGDGRLPRADREALAREALGNLRLGLEGALGDRERMAAMIAEIEEALEHDAEADPEKVRRLLAELDRVAAELGGVEVEELELDLAHVDPSALPAEYRERIQSYYKKLSERR